MKIRTHLLCTASLALTLAAGSAAASGPHPRTMEVRFTDIFGWDTALARVERIVPAGGNFEHELAKGYRSLAMIEGHQMYDWLDANYFAVKGLIASENRPTPPEEPKYWDLQPNHRAELQGAYDELMAALDNGAAATHPKLAATTQLQYDCWVEQQEENHQPDDIAACKTGFRQAMAELRQAMQPVQPAPQAAVPAPKPEEKLVVNDEIARQVVYFDWDRAEIRSDAHAQIGRFAEEMRPMKNILLFVEGHADRSGSSEYNQRLSERRAANVRAELLRQNLPVAELAQVTVTAKGESEPAVATADGVREQANRRVEIVARGKVERLVRVPTAAAPQQSSTAR